MRRLVQEARLADRIEIDSAGTGAWHVGESPDRRARAAARARGFELRGRARRFVPEDWARFDYVLALDRENFADLEQNAPSLDARGKLSLLRAFDPSAPPNASVPDPYYGGEQGFDEVIDLCLAACRGLLELIVRERGL